LLKSKNNPTKTDFHFVSFKQQDYLQCN